jgi:hypothetical protein
MVGMTDGFRRPAGPDLRPRIKHLRGLLGKGGLGILVSRVEACFAYKFLALSKG